MSTYGDPRLSRYSKYSAAPSSRSPYVSLRSESLLYTARDSQQIDLYSVSDFPSAPRDSAILALSRDSRFDPSWEQRATEGKWGGDRAGQLTAEPVSGTKKNVRSPTPSARKNGFHQQSGEYIYICTYMKYAKYEHLHILHMDFCIFCIF